MSWITLTEICVVWLNRPQNLSLVSVCKTPMWHCVEVRSIYFTLTVTFSPNYIITLTELSFFLNGMGDDFINPPVSRKSVFYFYF